MLAVVPAMRVRTVLTQQGEQRTKSVCERQTVRYLNTRANEATHRARRWAADARPITA